MRVRYTVASRERRRKILKRAKGFLGARSIRIKAANEAVMRAMRNEYIDRRRKKRDFRSLWITRISALVRANGMTYSRFIEGLSKAGVKVDRKVLSNLAATDPDVIVKYIELARTKAGK